MSNKLKKIFKKEHNIFIGALHFPPLLSYPNFPGFSEALRYARYDLKAFQTGGADSIIIENNYDIPHKTLVDPAVACSLVYLIQQLKNSLPLGISVLWNDYRTELAIAKILNLQYVRIPVFVDKVSTSYGIVQGKPKKILNYRKQIGAENVALFTDLHVKHAKLLSKHSLISSAKLAIRNNSDAIILTGNWTGDQPDFRQLKMMRQAVGNFPILLGSGINSKNVKKFLSLANGVIVSTSLKNGKNTRHEINVKPYSQRIQLTKVKQLRQNLS